MARQTRGWKWPLTAVGTSPAILYPLRPIYNYLPLWTAQQPAPATSQTRNSTRERGLPHFSLCWLWYYQVFTAVWGGKIFPCLYYNLKWLRGLTRRIALITKHHAAGCVPGAGKEVDSVDTTAAVTPPPPRPPPQPSNYGKECREIRTTSVQSLLHLHSPLSRQDNRYLSSPTPAQPWPCHATPRTPGWNVVWPSNR